MDPIEIIFGITLTFNLKQIKLENILAFALHKTLVGDTFEIGDLPICKLLLMNDSRYLWLVLVPKIENAIELHLLQPKIQEEVFRETMRVAEFISAFDGVEKINIGAIGNIVSQLHIHVIGRNSQDEVWPAPVWGKGTAKHYAGKEAENLIAIIKQKIFHKS